MKAEFYEKDGREYFKFIGKSHVRDVEPDVYEDYATDDHRKRFPAEYEAFKNPPVVEEVKKKEVPKKSKKVK
jgi:hypothetical protein